MPRLAANLSLLFCEHPLAQRFAAAASAGFSRVEVQFPYELPVEALREALKASNQTLELINLPAGDWAAGDRGIGCLPERRQAFRDGVEQALEYALALNVPRVNCLPGIRPAGLDATEADAVLVENLRHAAERFAPHGIRVLFEAINNRDIPGFHVSRSAHAWAILDSVAHPNLQFQYDVYHMQRMEGDLIETLRHNLARIGHIQVADVPGRHEPGSGEIHFPNLFRALDAMGYSGVVSLEYIPQQGTVEGLGWLGDLGMENVEFSL